MLNQCLKQPEAIFNNVEASLKQSSSNFQTVLNDVVNTFDAEENNNMFHLHEGIKYATLYDKESSKFSKVSYAGKVVTPEEERWIVFPYEEWWK